MNYMTFKDGTKIKIEDGSSLDRIVHIADNEASALFVCEKCTADNVSVITFSQTSMDSEDVIGEYEGLILNNPPTRQTNEDGLTVTVIISMHEPSELELRVAALEESQDIQDGAIDDLAVALSGEEV